MKNIALAPLAITFALYSCGEWKSVNPISKLKFDGNIDQDALSCSKITIIAYDKEDKETEATSSVTLALDATGGGFHPESEENCSGDEIKEVSLPSRNSRITVRYSATFPGNYDLTAEAKGKGWKKASTNAVIHNPLN